MMRFFVLLKKEIKELLTIQAILPLIIGMAVFLAIGNLVGGTMEKAQQLQGSAVVQNNDNSLLSNNIVNTLKAEGFKITELAANISKEEALTQAKEKGLDSYIVIPQGFGSGIEKGEVQKIKIISTLRSFSVTSGASTSTTLAIGSQINSIVSDALLSTTGGNNLTFAKKPVSTSETVVINGKSADISSAAISGFMMSQIMLIPIVIYMIILFASQMIVSAIANEKTDKTLETLLSAPISRTAVLTAKMLAAGLVSLGYALVYMVGFSSYMNGITGGAMSKGMSQELQSAIHSLGLTLSAGDFVLIGIQLFLSILIALAVSLILGALAEDIKSAQGLIAPITFIILIPYICSIFTDINALPLPLKTLIYIIPFTHTFTATPNMFLENYPAIFFGIAYQLIFLIAAMALATHIFNSDKIFTLKISFNRKKKA